MNLLFIAICSFSIGATIPSIDEISQTITEVEEPDLAKLESLYSDLSNLSRNTPRSETLISLKSLVLSYSKLSNLISAELDELNYNEDELIIITPPAPPGYPSGVSIESIKDEKLRKEYEVIYEKHSEKLSQQLQTKREYRALVKVRDRCENSVIDFLNYLNIEEVYLYAMQCGFSEGVISEIKQEIELRFSNL